MNLRELKNIYNKSVMLGKKTVNIRGYTWTIDEVRNVIFQFQAITEFSKSGKKTNFICTIHITTENNIAEICINNTELFDNLTLLVGGIPRYLELKQFNALVWINAKQQGLKENEIASKLLSLKVFGNILITGNKDEEDDTLFGLSRLQMKDIYRITDKFTE